MAWFQILVGVALSSVVLAGGLKVMKLRNHGFCVTAAIIALLPCFSPCCCLGIPFGIWALVVINRPEVRSQFR